jgi:hypothetical protein
MVKDNQNPVEMDESKILMVGSKSTGSKESESFAQLAPLTGRINLQHCCK